MTTRIRKAATDLRKRPSQRRSEATVSAILGAAARILEGAGPDALTTNAVAEVAGVSVGSLYQYFPNRTAILVELTRQERDRLRARVDGAVDATRGQDLERGVRALIEAAVAHQLDRPQLARALDFLEPSLSLDGESAALSVEIAAAVKRLLVAHKAARPAEAARDLVAMAKGMIDAAGLAGETDRLALAARVHRAAMGYLRR